MKRIIIPILAIIIPLAVLTAYNYKLLEEDKKESIIRELVYSGLGYMHYNDTKIDDDFSEKVFDMYLNRIDFSKNFLLEEDYNKLLTYRTKVDDEIKRKGVEFFKVSIDLVEKRKEEAEAYYKEALEQPFDYSIEETIELDSEKKKYAKDADALKDNWRKSMKYQVMLEVYLKDDIQKKDKEKNDTVVLKTFEELEINARAKVKKRNEDWFRRMNQIDKMDYLSLFLNSVSNLYDPHTSYYPPKDKEDFDINMSGRLEGIGATLQSKDGYVKVAQIIAGSPSWKQGELENGDLILKVAQEDGEPVDIVGMRLDKAVKHIRGKKGTKVILTVKKIDGEIKDIPIIRDIVVIEETYAKSLILNSPLGDKKYGYIYLPQFYADFSKRDGGRRASTDILKEITKLKSEGIDGLVFDLRNNGGGSLQDAVDMAGYFIDKGPIVQVREKTGNVKKHLDLNPSIEYDGPMVVMVNNGSASASEIFAAAMQDYNRAVIVGGKTTFGKGTVQNLLDLDRLVSGYASLKPYGALKITIQKFYRINGGSTQLKGVVPDVILPDQYMFIDVGEKELDYHLQWDEIDKADYQPLSQDLKVKSLSKLSQKRLNKSEAFNLIEKQAAYLKEVRENTIMDLKYTGYLDYQTERKELNKEFKNILKDTAAVSVQALKADWLLIENDTVKKASAKKWHKGLKKDIYLRESLHILEDINSKK